MRRTRGVLTVAALMLAMIGCGRPAVRKNAGPLAQAACEGVGVVGGIQDGRKGAPLILLEESHPSRVAQIQNAIALVRLHNQYGLRDIVLEGYLKEGPEINTQWVAAASGPPGEEAADRRAQVAVRLLKEGEIGSAEFLKLVYDDVLLHPAETAAEYSVDLDENAARVPMLYLVRIAQQSMAGDQAARAQQINKEKEALTGVERQGKSNELVEYIVSTDSWAQGKAQVFKEGANQGMSAEDMLAQVTEIERRANKLSIQFTSDESSAMQRNLTFWRTRLAASDSIVRAAGEIADRNGVPLVAVSVGAAHTPGMLSKLQGADRPAAVVTPLSLKNHEQQGDLTDDMLVRRYKGLPVLSKELTESLLQALSAHSQKMLPPGLPNPAIEAKTDAYLKIDRITNAVLGGGGPSPWNLNAEELRGKWIDIEPGRIEKILDSGPGEPPAVLFPITLNPNDPTKKKEMWVKAKKGRSIVKAPERRDVEQMLKEALSDLQSTDKPAPENEGNRVQITSDTVAGFAADREAAKKIAL